MNVKTLLTVNAVIALLFGVGFMFTPAPLVAYYGVSLGRGGLYIAQLFGSALIGFCILSWSVRNSESAETLNAVLLALFVSDIFGLLLSLWAVMGGVVNNLGWSTVAIYLILAIGFGYFRFIKKA